MSTAVQDELEDVAPVRLCQADSRAAVRAAIIRAAQEHEGLVHARFIRPYLPTNIHPQTVGQVFSTLWALDILVPTSRKPLKGGGGSGNAGKWLPVWRLTKPIPKDALK